MEVSTGCFIFSLGQSKGVVVKYWCCMKTVKYLMSMLGYSNTNGSSSDGGLDGTWSKKIRSKGLDLFRPVCGLGQPSLNSTSKWDDRVQLFRLDSNDFRDKNITSSWLS